MSLSGLFCRLKRPSVLVLGDLMLDAYTFGKVARVSPEAPVCVLKVEKEESRPGGVGNVALNLLSLGSDVKLAGRVGDDAAGELLCSCLESEGMDVRAVVRQKGMYTPVKSRMIAGDQQLLRVDHEEVLPLFHALEEELILKLPSLLEDVSVVAISDYAKGFLTTRLLEEVIVASKERGIPAVVDPKGMDYNRYNGAAIIKPNRKEAYQAAGLGTSASLDDVARAIFDKVDVETLMITLSENGIAVFGREGQRQDFPARLREVLDVTGAGDTVLATLVTAVGSGLDVNEAAPLCNLTAGIAIETVGCAEVNLSQLAERLLDYDVENKVFEEQHLFLLRPVMAGRAAAIVGMRSAPALGTRVFSKLKGLKEKGCPLIVYVRDEDADPAFVELIASFVEVDFIVLRKEGLEELSQHLSVHALYVLEGDVLTQVENKNALI